MKHSNIISIGKASDKFTRQIGTTFTKESIASLVQEGITRANLNEDIININLNTINQYFETGIFYKNFYSDLSFRIKKGKGKLFKLENESKVFVYTINFNMVYLNEMKYSNNFAGDIIRKYTIGLARDEGYINYLNDILKENGMEISFYETEIINEYLYFRAEIRLTHGELYNSIYRNYLRITF